LRRGAARIVDKRRLLGPVEETGEVKQAGSQFYHHINMEAGPRLASGRCGASQGALRDEPPTTFVDDVSLTCGGL
jgi:hypothetical protein